MVAERRLGAPRDHLQRNDDYHCASEGGHYPIGTTARGRHSEIIGVYGTGADAVDHIPEHCEQQRRPDDAGSGRYQRQGGAAAGRIGAAGEQTGTGR